MNPPRAVSLKRILRHWHRHWHRRHRSLLLRRRRRRRRHQCRCRSLRDFEWQLYKDQLRPDWRSLLPKSLLEKPSRKTNHVTMRLRLTVSCSPLTAFLRPSFSALRLFSSLQLATGIHPPTVSIFTAAINFKSDFRRGGRREIRARIALLLYRGLVNKLNQIRSALPRNRCFLRLRASVLGPLSPRPFFFFMAEWRRRKDPDDRVKGGEGEQIEVQRARGHCASSSQVGLLVSFLSLRRVLALV